MTYNISIYNIHTYSSPDYMSCQYLLKKKRKKNPNSFWHPVAPTRPPNSGKKSGMHIFLALYLFLGRKLDIEDALLCAWLIVAANKEMPISMV